LRGAWRKRETGRKVKESVVFLKRLKKASEKQVFREKD
jgi:hypothetical protein